MGELGEKEEEKVEEQESAKEEGEGTEPGEVPEGELKEEEEGEEAGEETELSELEQLRAQNTQLVALLTSVSEEGIAPATPTPQAEPPAQIPTPAPIPPQEPAVPVAMAPSAPVAQSVTPITEDEFNNAMADRGGLEKLLARVVSENTALVEQRVISTLGPAIYKDIQKDLIVAEQVRQFFTTNSDIAHVQAAGPELG